MVISFTKASNCGYHEDPDISKMTEFLQELIRLNARKETNSTILQNEESIISSANETMSNYTEF